MEDRREPIHLALILDRCGSLESQRPALLAGVNPSLALLPTPGEDQPRGREE